MSLPPLLIGFSIETSTSFTICPHACEAQQQNVFYVAQLNCLPLNYMWWKIFDNVSNCPTLKIKKHFPFNFTILDCYFMVLFTWPHIFPKREKVFPVHPICRKLMRMKNWRNPVAIRCLWFMLSLLLPSIPLFSLKSK